jgi:hypothetical protein
MRIAKATVALALAAGAPVLNAAPAVAAPLGMPVTATAAARVEAQPARGQLAAIVDLVRAAPSAVGVRDARVESVRLPHCAVTLEVLLPRFWCSMAGWVVVDVPAAGFEQRMLALDRHLRAHGWTRGPRMGLNTTEPDFRPLPVLPVHSMAAYEGRTADGHYVELQVGWPGASITTPPAVGGVRRVGLRAWWVLVDTRTARGGA